MSLTQEGIISFFGTVAKGCPLGASKFGGNRQIFPIDTGFCPSGSRKNQAPKPSGRCILQKTTHFNIKSTTKRGCTHSLSNAKLIHAITSIILPTFRKRSRALLASNPLRDNGTKEVRYVLNLPVPCETLLLASEGVSNAGVLSCPCLKKRTSTQPVGVGSRI